ncbi:Transcription antitermination protein NusB [Geodia barretti]|nr:Transcription antitermination protein NusB [Geodia barretti]
MFDGITGEGSSVDEIIGRYAPAIPVRLLSIVDRNVLRVAIYELFNRDNIPRNVIINEAVELASMFGSESSARFVNGVLGSVAHDMHASVDSAVN